MNFLAVSHQHAIVLAAGASMPHPEHGLSSCHLLHNSDSLSLDKATAPRHMLSSCLGNRKGADNHILKLNRLISYCCCNKTLGGKQVMEDSLFGFMVLESWVLPGSQEAWQQVAGIVAGTGSWDITYPSTDRKQRERIGNRIQLWTSNACPRLCISSSEAAPPLQNASPTGDQVLSSWVYGEHFHPSHYNETLAADPSDSAPTPV